MTSLFAEAGLPGGIERAITGEMHCRSTEEYWSFMNDVVPPVVAVFRDLEERTIEKIKREVYQLLADKLPGKEKNIPFGARLFTTVKPV